VPDRSGDNHSLTDSEEVPAREVLRTFGAPLAASILVPAVHVTALLFLAWGFGLACEAVGRGDSGSGYGAAVFLAVALSLCSCVPGMGCLIGLVKLSGGGGSVVVGVGAVSACLLFSGILVWTVGVGTLAGQLVISRAYFPHALDTVDKLRQELLLPRDAQKFWVFDMAGGSTLEQWAPAVALVTGANTSDEIASSLRLGVLHYEVHDDSGEVVHEDGGSTLYPSRTVVAATPLVRRDQFNATAVVAAGDRISSVWVTRTLTDETTPSREVGEMLRKVFEGLRADITPLFFRPFLEAAPDPWTRESGYVFDSLGFTSFQKLRNSLNEQGEDLAFAARTDAVTSVLDEYQVGFDPGPAARVSPEDIESRRNEFDKVVLPLFVTLAAVSDCVWGGVWAFFAFRD
jgi:hypothetical protein